MKGRKAATPRSLKSAWAKATRFPAAGWPAAAMSGVRVVPMLAPSTNGMAAAIDMLPEVAMAMRSPMVGADPCMSTVAAAPTASPANGVEERCSRMDRKSGDARRGRVASLMSFMPKKSRPKPMMASPP